MPKWDYVLVNLVRSYGMNYRRNGIKMADWKDKPVFEVMQMLGDEGYEFAAYDGQNYIFKKPIGSPQPAPGQPQRPPQAGSAQSGQNAGQGQRPPQPSSPQALQPRPPASKPPTGGLRSLTQRPTPQDDDS